jgi:D-alanine-D-alanine ligase
MDKDRYEVLPVLITAAGAWYSRPAVSSSFEMGQELDENDRLLLSPDPWHGGFLRITGGCVEPLRVDVVFPVLHGTYGEDGTLQGLLELANIPYVGCGVAASAVGMDKVLMKSAFRDNGLEVGPFFWFFRSQWRSSRGAILQWVARCRFPLFVKPANLGSSVGISRVTDPSGFEKAVELAAGYDRKILVEEEIPGREIEVSVLGNDEPSASVPGEIISHAGFYDFEEKYYTNTAELVIPAELPQAIKDKTAAVAIAAFKAVDGSGLARVDMFVTRDERVVVNEINTLPGFTAISMYPKLWEATGLPYSRLIDRLLELAMERHRDKQDVLTDRQTA